MIVFVYGTLMSNNRNHDKYMQNAKFISQAVLCDYAMYNLGTYPGIKPFMGKNVHGEIYEISHETLNELNKLEEEGELYIIQYTNITVDDKVFENVIIYVYNLPVTGLEPMSEDSQPWNI